jgi:L-ascorbate metabolism protein UlaG (beta-lactamase superfamily)
VNMKFSIAAVLFSCLVFSKTIAQNVADDTIATSLGTLTIHPVTHATFVLSVNDKTFYIDPTGGAAAFKGMKPPDMIVITDIHGDHFDQKTIDETAEPNTIVVMPDTVAKKLEGINESNMVVLRNGNRTKQFDIVITAIPMYNLPEAPDAKHTKGRGNGYLMSIGGKMIYISGDTEDIPEMRKLKNIDVAFICMNLPYTMDIRQAASAVVEFKPKIVYPYHYRGQDGLSDVQAFKNLVLAGDAAIDVRLKNWYP